MNIRNNLDSLNTASATVSSTQITAVTPVSSGGVESSGAETGKDSGVHTSLGEDQAQMSAAANLATLAASSDDVRADKVASIQSALQSGTYNVSPEAVATKIVQSMLE